MARRSDHNRDELRDMMLHEGHALMAEVGYSRFSAREIAKRVGYTVGTVHNVIGAHDDLVLEINTMTFTLWADALEAEMRKDPEDRIAALVHAYFAFAATHPNLWSAIYEHRLPPGREIPHSQAEARGRLTGIVAHEVFRALPADSEVDSVALTSSLVATVHGHCAFWISGSFALMGVTDPEEAALARVRDVLSAKG